MVQFIFERSEVNTSPDSAVPLRIIKVDSRGRVSIPSDIRRSMGLERGSGIILDFDLVGCVIVLRPENGQDSVSNGIRDCGSLGPGANPGPGPEKEGG